MELRISYDMLHHVTHKRTFDLEGTGVELDDLVSLHIRYDELLQSQREVLVSVNTLQDLIL